MIEEVNECRDVQIRLRKLLRPQLKRVKFYCHPWGHIIWQHFYEWSVSRSREDLPLQYRQSVGLS